ncbi:MAG: GTP 3',8-cyclase MoaA [Calditerrivibrio sp.]|nr:GTP 3',8-cyclase MoaA [Calditerrivibrio sp.]
MNELADKYGRKYKYIRVSITDRCNFRCKYCVPHDGFKFADHSNILRYEDILFVLKLLTNMGVKKVRITGGEPLVRKGLVDFVKMLRENTSVDDLTLTTNGALLSRFAHGLKKAGLDRINVSIDSLRPERYQQITGGFDLVEIINGIKTAQDAGFLNIKINTVLIKGFNDDEIIDFCDFASEHNVTVRFIEFMPIGNFSEWSKDSIIKGKEVIDEIAKYFELKKIEKHKYEGPALNYRLSNGAKIGIITPVSNHFCGDCDKLRLTSDGKLRPCLLSDKEIDLNDAIKTKDEGSLIEKLKQSLEFKDWSHHLDDCSHRSFKRTMSKIGG